MVALLFAALIGGLGTFALFLPYGWLIALIAGSFGGSFLALTTGVFFALQKPRRLEEKQAEQSARPHYGKPKARA